MSCEQADHAFICCASFERRCRGVIDRFAGYRAECAYVFKYDEPSAKREENLDRMRQVLRSIAHQYDEIETMHQEPLPAVREILRRILGSGVPAEDLTLTLDITTFTKGHLLLLLRGLELSNLLPRTRLLYTEPGEYVAELDRPLSFGLRQISVIPSFTGSYDASKDLLLVLFLGYEEDRAMGLWQNIEPHDTILVLPRPPYHPEWDLVGEEINSALIAAVGEGHLRYAHSRDPAQVALTLEAIFGEKEHSPEQFNYFVCPLGTKPQTVGIYRFFRDHPFAATLVYAAPLRHNEAYFSKGVGRTWVLPL